MAGFLCFASAQQWLTGGFSIDHLQGTALKPLEGTAYLGT